jgi:hypothetical protein
MKILAVRAVKRGLTDESDNHKAGTLGVQALRGLGEFVSGQQVSVDGAVNITFAWQAPQDPREDAECIDVTPSVAAPPIEAGSRQIEK